MDTWRRQRGAVVVAAAIAIVTLAGLTQATALQAGPDRTRTGATCDGDHWVAAWAAVPQSSSLGRPDDAALGLADGTARTFSDQSLRMLVAPHVGGGALRVHLSNRFGTAPVTIGGATVGLTTSGASLAPGTVQPLTFAGQWQVVIEPGGEAISDPLFVDVHPFEPLAVSAHVVGTSALDYHQWAQTTNFVTPSGRGDHSADASGAAFTDAVTSSYLVSSVDVLTSRRVGAVVALGDSITDGIGSTPGQNRRWTDALARRVSDSSTPLSIVSAGIGGNRVAPAATGVGRAAVARVDDDVLSQPGVTDVFVFEGINDISGAGPDTDVVAAVVAGYRHIIERAHGAGLRVTAATITPAGLRGSRESARREINDWIRDSGAFDEVVDFDRAARDPRHPWRVRRSYDAAMAHLTDAGYHALAEEVDPSLFQGTGCGA